jgi:Ala-tRNA(Pro) deacylase
MTQAISPISPDLLQENMPTSPEALMGQLKALGIAFTLYEHEAVFTVEQANRIDDLIPGTHTRNLFLKDKKGAMFLVTLRHDTKVDLNKLNVLLGAGRFSFGSPERLWQYLGVRPGSVTPFSIINDKAHEVVTVLEKGMMEQDIVNYHPLLNTMTIGLSPEGLLNFLKSVGVEPRIIDLSAAAPDPSLD